jgi:vancomycin resistance protein YoaR
MRFWARVGATRTRRIAFIVGAIVSAVVLVPLIGSIVEHAMYKNRVLPGVRIESTHVGGKNKVEAYDAIARVANDVTRTPLRVRVGDHQFTVDASLIGLNIDVDATTHRAVRDGRQGNPFSEVMGTVLRRFRPDDVPLDVRYDTNRVEGLLDGWANQVDRDLVEGKLRFEGTKVIVVAPHPGVGLQRAEARRRLLAGLERTDRSDEVELPVGPIEPQVSAAAVEAAAARARTLLSGTTEIRADNQRVELSPKSLVGTLETHIKGDQLVLTIDPLKLRLALGPKVAPLEHPAMDATFAVTSANAVSVVPSQDGTTLDVETLAHDILAGNRVVTARLHKSHPVHNTKWAKALGITRQVSSFTTYHPAGQARVQNIHRAADVLNNTVVEPGQVFSLNGKLGPRTAEKGYVKAPILVSDGFGEDFGGGVSQLTTTLYNAVFFGGYEEVEHTPHQFYISRYPMGREATVNYPSIDLKFRDDTSHGILIRTAYSDTSITVTLYGDNEGRTVHEEFRHEYNNVPITDQLVTCPVKNPLDDPAGDCAKMLALTRKTVATGEPGWDVEFDRVIDQPGKPEFRRHYRVHYPMLPNKVLVGIVVPSSTTSPSTAKPPKSTSTTVARKH